MIKKSSKSDQNQHMSDVTSFARIVKAGEKAEKLGQEILKQQQVKTTSLLKIGFLGISALIGLTAVKILWDAFGPKK